MLAPHSNEVICMRSRAALLCLLAAGLLAACSPADPKQLAAASPWDAAREHGRFLHVGDLDVFAVSLGAGPDVVLVHGMLDSSFTWRLVAPALAEHHRVHVVDLPGFGFSSKPEGARYETAWLADELVAILDALQVQRAFLVGNSMGGHVATEVAIRHPERVAGLVLLGASGVPEPVDVAAKRSSSAGSGDEPWAVRLLRQPMGQAIVRALPTRNLLRGSLEPAYYRPEDLSEERLSAWQAPLQTENGMAAYLARSRQPVPAERAKAIRGIRAPTLVIAGHDDRMVPESTASTYHELIPDSELQVWPKTGHMIQEQRPERVVSEVTRWVAEHS
jgi:pimeloyl-ACP methyl ester carboxylesterase